MDNVTHTLIGITLGKALTRKEPNAGVVRAAVWTAMIGSNFPDIDFVVHFIYRHGEVSRLAYLLHHRGWTHTVLGALPLGAIAAWIGAKIGKRRLDWKLVAFGVFSVLFHIFSDFWNEYGVHPFSPFLNGWFYGDSIFILEPSFWLMMAPLALGGKLWDGIRGLWWLPVAGVLGLLWFGSYVSLGVAAALSVLFLLSFFAYRRTGEPLVTLAGLLLLLGIFSYQSHSARQGVEKALRAEGWNVHGADLLLGPAPGNPLCWRVIASSQIQDDWVTALGSWTQWPSVIDPRSCHFRGLYESDEIPYPLQKTLLAATAQLNWTYEFRGSLGDFRRLRRENAAFERFLGFSRFPYWKIESSTGNVEFGDLRFVRGGSRGFAQYVFPLQTTEGEGLPQWKGVLYDVR